MTRGTRSLAVAVVAAAGLIAPASAAAWSGDLALIQGPAKEEIWQPSVHPRNAVYAGGKVFITPNGRPLELHARRNGSRVELFEVDRSSGSPALVPLGLTTEDFHGLPIVELEIRRRSGELVHRSRRPVCTNDLGAGASVDRVVAGRTREFGHGGSCGGSSTRAATWVLHTGRALALADWPLLRLQRGRYTVTVRLDPDQRFPDADRANNTASFEARVVATPKRRGAEREPPPRRPGRGHARSTVEQEALLPDLVALPGRVNRLRRHRGRDWLTFDSTVANFGTAMLELTGSRSDTRGTTMPARQITPGGTHDAGEFVWDPRDGHGHWHYNRLAGYELLDNSGRVVRRSGKVGFCFVGTDMIDVQPVPGPTPPPTPSGNPTQCGKRDSRQILMQLPAGWGDTYTQAVAGQAFDVTDLRPGRYTLRVTVNVSGRIAELTAENNTSEVPVLLVERRGEPALDRSP
jgi:hypothetical protein